MLKQTTKTSSKDEVSLFFIIKKPANFQFAGFLMWSWRDSNSRPNKQYASFLHAYSAFGFRRKAESRHPTLRLSSIIFVFWPKFPKPYFCIAMPRNPTSQNRTLARHLVSLLYFGKNANPTKLQIKQQEQTLGCQL